MEAAVLAWAASGGVSEDTAAKLVKQWRRGIISTRQMAENIAMEAPDMSKGPMFVGHSSGGVTLLRNRSTSTFYTLPPSPPRESTPELVKVSGPVSKRHAPGVRESWVAHVKDDESYKVAVYWLEAGQDPAQWAAAWNYVDGSGYHWESRGGVLVGLPKGRPVPSWLDACTGPNPS